MGLRAIVIWPDACLASPCAAIGTPGPEHRELAQDMLATMYEAPGRGLAAPQVGVLLRLFVMDATWKEGAPDPQVMIDPVILAASDLRVAMDEGCLSIPDITTRITRPNAIRAGWTDLDGERHEADLTGAAARIFQHELDHLDGIVTLDRLAPEARAEALAEYAP